MFSGCIKQISINLTLMIFVGAIPLWLPCLIVRGAAERAGTRTPLQFTATLNASPPLSPSFFSQDCEQICRYAGVRRDIIFNNQQVRVGMECATILTRT